MGILGALPCPNFKELITKSLENLAWFFTQGAQGRNRSPVTYDLFKNAFPIRHFSNEFCKNSLRALSRLSNIKYTLPSECNNPVTLKYLYRIGDYSSFNELSSRFLNDKSLMPTQIAFMLRTNENPFLIWSGEVRDNPHNLEEIELKSLTLLTITALAFKKTAEDGNNVQTLIDYLNRLNIENNLFTEIIEKNSLNLIEFAYERYSECFKILDSQWELLCKETGNISHQARGINQYHRSLIYRKMNDSDLELDALNKAIVFDPEFYDYSYRIAQIYHDRGDERARSFYEKALSVSSLDDAIVNDYGVFLHGAQSPFLKEWELIATTLGIDNSAN